jgi:hypothetical protein
MPVAKKRIPEREKTIFVWEIPPILDKTLRMSYNQIVFTQYCSLKQ